MRKKNVNEEKNEDEKNTIKSNGFLEAWLTLIFMQKKI